MTIKNKNLIIKIIFALFVINIFNLNLFGLIMGNWPPYDDCKDCDSKSTINTHVIEGCGYFLNAYSDILLFLNRIELSDLKDIDYEELQKIVDNAVANMNKAKTSYLILVELSASTPYIPGAIEKLKDFDYDGFQREHQLNSIIFQEVVYYLKDGDVRGIYSRLLVDIENILNNINLIKSSIYAKTFPEIPALWKINQMFSSTMLFGQYAAQVFNSIR